MVIYNIYTARHFADFKKNTLSVLAEFEQLMLRWKLVVCTRVRFIVSLVGLKSERRLLYLIVVVWNCCNVQDQKTTIHLINNSSRLDISLAQP